MGAPATKVLQILSRDTQKTFIPKIVATPKIVDITDTTVKTSKYVQKLIDTQA